LKVLIVDDEDMILTATSRLLGKMGHDAEVAGDGESAVEKYRESLESASPYSIVIIDVNMPESFGGEELLKRLLDIDPHVKGIVSSGNMYEPQFEDFSDHGFFDSISKPFSVSELSRIIEKADSSGN